MRASRIRGSGIVRLGKIRVYGPAVFIEDDISENSPCDGTNDTDYLYVPKVIEALKKAGFDCYFGLDPFENNEIIIVVPFNTRDIEVTSVETTEKFE